MTGEERLIFALRSLYERHGYKLYRMSKFEEYDLYAGNRGFLISDDVITFTDKSGRLLALKPDVTLSIVKNTRGTACGAEKLCYNENVYRAGKSGTFSEIMQTGLECIGEIDDGCVGEVLTLAAESLDLISHDFILEISHTGLLSAVKNSLGLAPELACAVMTRAEEKNVHEIRSICARAGADESACENMCSLVSLYGKPSEVMDEIARIASETSSQAEFEELASAVKTLCSSPYANRVRIDFSVGGNVNYYNGIVFKGFVNGVPEGVLSGGRYDGLLKKLSRSGGAIGFAVYLNTLEHLRGDTSDALVCGVRRDGMLNVALPKGRLGEKVYGMFDSAGYGVPSVLGDSRRLTFEDAEKGVRYFWVKPSDVAIYVEHGAADIGVAGKDILLEYEPDVYELCDLDCGRCRIAVAARRDFEDDGVSTLRVATKFPKIAADHYASLGRNIDIIELNGSIELAPLLGLSDVIVDIVETGTTLRENELCTVSDVVPISARLIANKSSFQFKNDKINEVAQALGRVINGRRGAEVKK